MFVNSETLSTAQVSIARSELQSMQRQRLVVLAAIVVIGLFYGLTFRAGHAWGDDFAMYIIQARNLAAGQFAGPTGYIYNPNIAVLGPRAYPPLFPLLLAPIYLLRGLDFTAMKVGILLLFLAALYLIFEICRKRLDFLPSVAVVLTVGFSPLFWEFKDNVVSDLPFLFSRCSLSLSSPNRSVADGGVGS